VEIQIDQVEPTRASGVRLRTRDAAEVLERIRDAVLHTRDEGTGLGVVVARAAFAQHEDRMVTQRAGMGTMAVGRSTRSIQRSNDGAGAAG